MKRIEVFRPEGISNDKLQLYTRVSREELIQAGYTVPEYYGDVFYLSRANYKILLEAKDDNERKNSKKDIDPATKFNVGSKEYGEYYYPKIDKSGRHK